MPKKRAPSKLWIPAFGLVRGGRLDGWRYLFLWFVARPITPDRSELLVRARVTPPAWPFPCDIDLRGGEHFASLEAVPGERAKRRRAEPLIESAFEIAGLELSTWTS